MVMSIYRTVDLMLTLVLIQIANKMHFYAAQPLQLGKRYERRHGTRTHSRKIIEQLSSSSSPAMIRLD
jgi:hypothetical protein